MDSGKECSRSTADHHANGDPRHFLRAVRDGGIHKQFLFGSVRFWSVSYKNDFCGSRVGTNDSIPRRPLRIQRRGRRIVDGKGNDVSRLRGNRALVPDDGDVAIRFSHALRGGSFGVPFDQDGDCRLEIFPVALVGNVPLKVKESRHSFGLYRLGNVV